MIGRRSRTAGAVRGCAGKPAAWGEESDAAPARGPRLRVFVAALAVGFIAVAAQLTRLGQDQTPATRLAVAETRHALSRPDILDRRGRILASDITVYGLYADPVQILDAEEAAESVTAVLKRASPDGLRERLVKACARARSGGKEKHGFVWMARGLTPREADAVYALGLPGVYLVAEPGRVYPAGTTASHVLGYTNVDNEGKAGVEQYIDGAPHVVAGAQEGSGGRPTVRLSIDIGAQHVVEEEMRAAMETYKAKAALGLVLDVRTGEVLAMASRPDYDPNRREQAVENGRQNRFLAEAYELGSVFKTFTVAMGIDYGVVTQYTNYDVMTPLQYGRRQLVDRHAHSRFETVEEIFINSSNTGAARIALDVGGARQKAFLERLGLLKPLVTEAGESVAPRAPAPWREVNTATIAYGHGLAVPPLSFASASAALVNGGWLLTPTFLPRSRQEARVLGRRVMRPETSVVMRRLMRANVERGTGKLAEAPGYFVGGKTGTAMKVEKGRYGKDVMTSFVAAFPMGDPQYLVTVTLDEPEPTDAARRRTEAAWNAAPVVGAIIRRLAPMLGVPPADSGAAPMRGVASAGGGHRVR